MKCPVCEGASFQEKFKADHYSVLKCTGCGLGITWPMPSEAQVEEFNRANYEGEQRNELYASRKEEFEERYRRILTNIKSVAHGTRLLDVGANIGLFVRAADLAGFESIGVELNDSCASFGRLKLGLDIRTVPLERAGFTDGAFEVVTMLDVLEHVPDPGRLLREAHRVLTRDGILVVQSPNLDSVMASLLKENWRWLSPRDHLYHFTPVSLSLLMEKNDFRVMRLHTWEPAGDFEGNIYSGFPGSGLVGRTLRKMLWLSSVALVPIFQRLWWKTGKGGLIQIYASKTTF